NAMPLVGSCECRPDFRQLVANGSFAIDAFFVGQIRPAFLRRIGRLHRNSAANRLDVEGWYLVSENDGSRCEQYREPNAPLKNDAHAIPRQFVLRIARPAPRRPYRQIRKALGRYRTA